MPWLQLLTKQLYWDNTMQANATESSRFHVLAHLSSQGYFCMVRSLPFLVQHPGAFFLSLDQIFSSLMC